jgi:MFS family permease
MPGTHRSAIRRLALASLVSVIGTQAANIGLITLIYVRTGHSGAWIAAIMVANYATRLACAPWAGAMSDRFDRRKIMLASNFASAVVFLCLAYAQSPWLIVALAAVASAAQAPLPPASSALIGSLVPAEERGWANSMRAAAGASGMLIGGLIGGALIAAAGSAAAFVVNAASFFIAALIVSSVRGAFRVQPISRAHEHQGLSAGLRLLRVTPALAICSATMALTLLSVGMANVAEYPLVVAIGGTSTGYGIIVGAWAAGQFVGARLARRISTPRAEKLALGGGLLGTAVCTGFIGVVPSIASMVALFAVSGISFSIANVSATGVLQRWSPDEVRGRVFSAYTGLQQAALGLSLVLGGTLLPGVEPRVVFVIAGILGITAALVALRMPPRGPNRSLPQLLAQMRRSDETPPRIRELAAT